jgi:hypothetical protein
VFLVNSRFLPLCATSQSPGRLSFFRRYGDHLPSSFNGHHSSPECSGTRSPVSVSVRYHRAGCFLDRRRAPPPSRCGGGARTSIVTGACPHRTTVVTGPLGTASLDTVGQCVETLEPSAITPSA